MPLLLVLSLVSAQDVSLVTARQQTLRLAQQHGQHFPGHRCEGRQPEWHTDSVVFPTGRADRVYVYSARVVSAYRRTGRHTRLVWCAVAVDRSPGWTPTGLLARALGPLRTTAGARPTERGPLDGDVQRGGQVTFARLDAAGRWVCQRDTPAGDNLHSALQFDVGDHCP